MDYSKMSDFEINRAVAIAKGFPPDDCDIAKRGSPLVGVEWNDDTGYAIKAFDYCNNPADAWPIIVENGIGIKKQSNGMWCATRQGGLYPQYHENPLRAAMVVFLHMQESANVQTDSTR
ncbi:DUF2591 domain-containing protein [Shigella sonnei]|nr:DUF2591 domain-containing protein [Shigella sonnei]